MSSKQTLAAFDIGSGAIKVSVYEVIVRTSGTMIQDELFSHQTELLLQNDLILNGGDSLSYGALHRCKCILKTYKERADALKAIKCTAIATAVFRRASNGLEFLKDVQASLGIRCQVIEQRLEGRIGFLTGWSVAGGDAKDLIVWDCGGGSFQLTNAFEETFEGPLGSANTTALLVKDVQGKSMSVTASPNPCSIENCEQLKEIIIGKFEGAHHPSWLNVDSLKMGRVVAIGGSTCAFRMAQKLLHSKTISRDALWSSLGSLTEKTDDDLSYFEQPKLLLPKLVLVYSVMSYFGIDEIQYHFTNGCTRGMLLNMSLW